MAVFMQLTLVYSRYITFLVQTQMFIFFLVLNNRLIQ